VIVRKVGVGGEEEGAKNRVKTRFKTLNSEKLNVII
jgi:hypothetical protein